MPSIYLKETSSYFSGFVSVKEQEYGPSKLFKSFKHQLNQPSKGPIWISNHSYPKVSYFLGFWDFWGRYLTITTGREYTNAKLKEVDVYYNVYDTNYDNPLVFVIHFEDGQNKYYNRSQFDKDINSNKTKNISDLHEYNNEKDIFTKLLEENDSLENILTYDVGKRQDDADGRNVEYNDKKITVTDDSSQGQPNLSSTKFKRYKHTPVGAGNRKNACVIFDNNLLSRKDKTPIRIQNQKYDYICVYFSNIVREPLLVEFCTNRSNVNFNKYYYYTRDTDNSLYWKKIKKNENVLDVQLSGSTDVYSELTKFNGKLFEILTKLESDLQKTIIFMVNKQDKYELNDFKSSFSESSKYRIINQSITPSEKTDSLEGNCIGKYGYKVFEHDFTTSIGGIKRGEKVRLRFIIPKSSDTTYNEITLYKIDTISEYKNSEKKLYVYFYGKDPRPLLLFYNSSAYTPQKLGKPIADNQVGVDYTKWVKVDNINQYTCSGDESTTGKNKELLLNTLYELSMFLNPVYLGKTINAYKVAKKDTKKEHTYLVQEFAGKKIEIKVKVTDLLCYRQYTFESAMVDSGGVVKREYRLGNLEYHGRDGIKTCLTYPNHLPLQSVSLYYYMYDKHHNYPLIIQLDYWFQGPLDDYFRVCKIGEGSRASTQATGPAGPNGGAALPKNIFPFRPRKP